MDDATLKYYHSMHLRHLVQLERRVQVLSGLISDEVHEMNVRGLLD